MRDCVLKQRDPCLRLDDLDVARTHLDVVRDFGHDRDDDEKRCLRLDDKVEEQDGDAPHLILLLDSLEPSLDEGHSSYERSYLFFF